VFAGLASHLFALFTLVFLASSGVIDPTYAYKHFAQLITAGTVIIFIASGVLYWSSFNEPDWNVAEHGDTGAFRLPVCVSGLT